jgi:hypothetical protein
MRGRMVNNDAHQSTFSERRRPQQLNSLGQVFEECGGKVDLDVYGNSSDMNWQELESLATIQSEVGAIDSDVYCRVMYCG